MGVVVLLTLIFQAWVCSTGGRGGIRGKREELLQKRCNVGRRLGGRFVSIRACFDLGQDCFGISRKEDDMNVQVYILFSLSIAHCSNCSRVISAVGGIS